MSRKRALAIAGSGPAALMVADIVSVAGHAVTVFEKKKGPGRKILIAGSSGLNISNSLPLEEFASHYSGGESTDFWKALLREFSPDDWLRFIHALGLETFEGTSGRYFVREMKASKLLRAWLNRLDSRGVRFRFEHELEDFSRDAESGLLSLKASGRSYDGFDALCLCLGGGSYEPKEKPLRWPSLLTRKGIGFDEFIPSNVGYRIEWSEAFLKEAEGKPLKNIRLTTSRGSRKGDLVVTRYGIEGTPIYSLGTLGEAHLDLKPDLSAEQILARCQAIRENLSPIRRVKKQLKLSEGSLALLFHMAPKDALTELPALVGLIKAFPLLLSGTQSLDESISAAGGVHLTELDGTLMFRKLPGVFAAGEMLDWDAPTGGFLIQGCVSQGFRAGHRIAAYLRARK